MINIPTPATVLGKSFHMSASLESVVWFPSQDPRWDDLGETLDLAVQLTFLEPFFLLNHFQASKISCL